MLASREDIQAWLRQDIVPVNDANSQKPNLEALRDIRGQLVGTFAVTVLNSWDSPDNTPEQIRSIAGRLAAAYMYRMFYSERGDEVPPYAQELYNEAIAKIAQIQTGAITVVDDTGTPIDITGANLLSFWPNDSSPSFTMDKEFA